MNLRQVANEYVRGVELRTQASHINRKALTAKFERSRETIMKIINGQPVVGVPEWEKNLIIQLDNERSALQREAASRTLHTLSLEHRYSQDEIVRELYLMGYYEEPADA